ncbi:MAG: CHRD domain-containing protein [Saprospiraceae bacterium]|nr:CHRD domain-containing protein [Saprospiraceae bacterium]
MKRILNILVCLLLIHSLCAQNSGNWLFTGYLNGDEEVPVVSTMGQGYVTILIDKDFTTAQINGLFTGLSGDITGCHLHVAESDENGPVIVNLKDYLSGNKLFGKINLPSNLLYLLNSGLVYINVHTAANPGGEIRSQLNSHAELNFASLLLGSNSVPPVATQAVGLAVLQLDLLRNVIEYQVQLTNLSGPITSAHIHDGDSETNGPVLVDLNVSGNILKGEINLEDQPLDFLIKLLLGAAYINVHTSKNPGGEIRGQIGYGGSYFCSSTLNGSQEVPAVNSNATGLGFIISNFTLDTLTYLTVYDGLSSAPTAAHIHSGQTGMNGPVVLPLNPTQLPGLYFGSFVINNTNLALLTNSSFYNNIHTSANPGGEIRGQIISNIRKGQAFDLCGTQSVPSNSSKAYGVCGMSIGRSDKNLIYEVIQDGITSAVTSAHIHSGAKGINGGVLLPIGSPDKFIDDIIPVNSSEVLALESKGAYVNIHSEDYPSGEIRGQVDNLASCLVTAVSDISNLPNVSLLPNPAQDQITVDFGILIDEKVIINIVNLDGRTISSSSYYGGNKCTVSLNNIPDGIYSLDVKKMKDGKRLTSQKFVVKQ